MKKIFLTISITLLLAISLPAPVHASQVMEDQVSIGGIVRIESGEKIDGSLIVLGGKAVIAFGANVSGDVVIIGGQAEIEGDVGGNLVLVGSEASLLPTARLVGNVESISSRFDQATGAQVKGQIHEIGAYSLLSTGLDVDHPAYINPLEVSKLNFSPVMQVTGSAFQSFLQAIFAMLVALIFPRRLKGAAIQLSSAILRTTSFGLLAAIVSPLLIAFIAITIIGIPLAMLGAIALVLVVIFGYIAIGAAIGIWIAAAFKSQWHIAVCAGVGTMLLALVMALLSKLGPGGIIVIILIHLLGMGSVVLTRFGRRERISN